MSGTALQRWTRDDWSINVSVVDGGGQPINLTGFHPAAEFTPAGSTVHSDLNTSNGGITVNNPAVAPQFTVNVPRLMSAAATAGLGTDPLPNRILIYWLDTYLKRQTAGVIAFDVFDGSAPSAVGSAGGVTVVVSQGPAITLQVAAQQGPAGPSAIASGQITDGGTTGVAVLKAANAAAARAAMGSAGAGRTAVADANYQVVTGDVVVGFSTLTAPRTVTLPAPAQYPVGQTLVIQDETGNCSAQMPITVVAPAGSTIAGQGQITLSSPFQRIALTHNGANLWTFS